ncbi:MAG: His/Gly/Thr/Pro-type tRNA ligase C-terminal domain-containing protein, partial [Clostridium paraputrificum]
VLPISNKFEDYSKKVRDTLNEAGIRVELDGRDEKIGYKIREARNERVPYMIVIGEKEENLNKISLRSRKNGDEGIVNLDELILRINEEVENKSL